MRCLLGPLVGLVARALRRVGVRAMSRGGEVRRYIDALPTGGTGQTFVVGTFADENRWRIRAYLRGYLPTWPGCIEYEVLAVSGAAARKAAIEARHKHEKEMREVKS